MSSRASTRRARRRLLAPPRTGPRRRLALRPAHHQPAAGPRPAHPRRRSRSGSSSTRAAVLPMTLFAGLVAGLLAVRRRRASPGRSTCWRCWGSLLAHACNNIMNDLSDTDVGLDTDGLPAGAVRPAPDPVGDGRGAGSWGSRSSASTSPTSSIMVVLATAARLAGRRLRGRPGWCCRSPTPRRRCG